jgi:hypothetical protein
MKKWTLLLLGLAAFSLQAQNALHFDGIDDRVDCGNDVSLQLSGQLTLEAWIYANTWKISVFQGCIINKEQNVPDYGYMLRAGQGGRLGFNLGNGSWHEIISAPLLSLNTWHHVAATYDGSKMRLFIDGVQTDSLSLTISIGNAANNLFIGDWYSNGRNFNGIIEEVRVWNVARTKAEIQATMNSALCVLPPGLVAYYPFNQGNAGGNNAGLTSLFDQSGNGNDGILANFSLSGSSSNWVAGQNLPGGSTISSITVNACVDYISPSGNNVWNASGTYTDTIPNAAGCDSVITVDLTIVEVDVTLGLSGGTLMANAINAYFQWVDCDNNFAPIPGAVNQSYTPYVVGNYACIVTQYGCTDTSICVPITTVGQEVWEAGSRPLLYPNPMPAGQGYFTFPGHPGQVELMDLTGRVVWQEEYKGQGALRLPLQKPGLYVLHFHSEKLRWSRKLGVGN